MTPSSPSSLLLSFLQFFLPEDLLVPHHPPTRPLARVHTHSLAHFPGNSVEVSRGERDLGLPIWGEAVLMAEWWGSSPVIRLCMMRPPSWGGCL